MFLLLPVIIGASFCALLPVGTAIEKAACASELLDAASRIPAPSPDGSFPAPHLAQDVHQLKRQQLASNALSRLSKLLLGSGARRERQATLCDERFLYLSQCAAEPSFARQDGVDRLLDAQSARNVARALESLASICAADAADLAGRTDDLEALRASAACLALRAEGFAGSFGLAEAVTSRWAIRRLFGRALETPALDALAAPLPFDLHPGAVVLPLEGAADCVLPSMAALLPSLDVKTLGKAVPFEQAELLTADGRKVRERRQTAWLAEDGIGALAYSGKLMNPSPLGACDTILALRDGIERDLGERFDCALTNFYAKGGQAACAWHRDPEHGDVIDGAKWARPTYVVSVGETRRFAFRRHRQPGQAPLSEDDRHVVHLFTGDVIAMHDNCNDAWEHSVLAGDGERNAGARISIVFKRALVGSDGKRGHTLEGQGRRARARARQESSASDTLSAEQPRGGGRGGASRGGRGGRGLGSRSRTRAAVAAGRGRHASSRKRSASRNLA